MSSSAIEPLGPMKRTTLPTTNTEASRILHTSLFTRIFNRRSVSSGSHPRSACRLQHFEAIPIAERPHGAVERQRSREPDRAREYASITDYASWE
jgi:hypothetical protein